MKLLQGRGKNSKLTTKKTILKQLDEPRPLPMGRKEFQEWSTRIISGACLPGGEEDPEAFIQSQKYALANMLMHLGPTVSYEADIYFIHSLRKVAINQVADALRKELYEAAKTRTAEKEKEQNEAEGLKDE